MTISPYWAARLRYEDERAEREAAEANVVPFPVRPEPELVELDDRREEAA